MILKELKKLSKLKILRLAFLINIILLSLFIFKEKSKMNFFDFNFSVILDMTNVIFFYNILIYIILGEIVSEENKSGIFTYIILKERDYRKVIRDKILATLLVSYSIFILDILLVFIYGIFFKQITPYSLFNNYGKLILKDTSIVDSFIRMFLLNYNIMLGILMTSMICTIVAVLSISKFTTIISSFITVLLLTYPINIKGKAYSIIYYKLPLLNLDLNIREYSNYVLSNGFIYLLISTLLYFIVIFLWKHKYEL